MPNTDLRTGMPSPATGDPELFPFRKVMQRFLPMQRLRELYSRARSGESESLLENLLTEMKVESRVSESDLARIPRSGPVIVAANHPFGLLDGAVLGALVSRVRPDVKIVTNFLLSGIPELHDHCLFVDPFGRKDSIGRNRRVLRQALDWLRGGGLLAMFPAGEVSHLQLPQMEIADSDWNDAVARLARLSSATAVPVWIRGQNSVAFQAIGMVHPNLRMPWLVNEFLQQSGKKVEVYVGNGVGPSFFQSGRSDAQSANYLRWRSSLLGQRARSGINVPERLKLMLPQKKQEPVANAIEPETLRREIAGIDPKHLYEQNREFAVYVVESNEIPNLLQEIGRLREVTFREVGEGTGRGSDLDSFDAYYKHVLLWSKTNQELVGAYRLGITSEILPHSGLKGLYTNTLFRYDQRIFERFGPAVELGRSFIRLEYQKQYAPLLMLWKGIGQYLVQNPRLAVVFGAVSISSRYKRMSRELIVRYFQKTDDEDLSRFVAPRRPFRTWGRPTTARRAPEHALADLQQLADPISDMEDDAKGIPILIKHYAKLGGRLLAFNVDKDFSNVVDGLVVVDLRRSDPVVLARYMGAEGLEAFRRYHGSSALVGKG
jgi:putative hemolysin